MPPRALCECYVYMKRKKLRRTVNEFPCFIQLSILAVSSVDHSNINDVAVIVAALGHDAGHPARNNQFFVNTCDPLVRLLIIVTREHNRFPFIFFP